MNNEYFDPTNKPPEPRTLKVEDIVNEHMGKDNNELTININDYLAILNVMTQKTFDGTPREIGTKNELENIIKIYAYLRDKYHAKTGYEALNMIRDGEIDKKIIKLWIDEHMTDSEILTDAIQTGYPGIKDEME